MKDKTVATIQYHDGNGRRRTVAVAAATRREIERFDRAVRRANQGWYSRVLTNADGALGQKGGGGNRRVQQIVGFLATEHEPAARSLGIKPAEKPGEWEGPRVSFDLVLTGWRPWDGATFQYLWSRGVCPVCQGADLGGRDGGEVVVTIVCAGCGRCNCEERIAGKGVAR